MTHRINKSLLQRFKDLLKSAPPAERGTREVLMLTSAGLASIIRGIAYLPFANPEGATLDLSPIEGIFPLGVWAVMWILIGAAVLVAVEAPRWTLPSLSAMSGIMTAWGVSYLFAWKGGANRAWVTGVLLLMIAVWLACCAGMDRKQCWERQKRIGNRRDHNSRISSSSNDLSGEILLQGKERAGGSTELGGVHGRPADKDPRPGGPPDKRRGGES